ncbi:nucleolar GTP-binding protein-like protein 2 [Boeremia exigua]|uniref:nucleolar GTP-binding protein-like protein 2 n=1 Tax=Boeremia exigua TaxID=749465 RepID=UPI001E8D649A|nr:nucleolar GTP-binding protein-like protein 2 [Boeremia exigua]KAH6615214.1 nucleolar GTP-binding protein-like protein 2 [Boeremia exigua]
MKIGKPKSKRQPVRLRHKIEKASVQKQKKAKKLAKKNPEWRSKTKKDPGIPNLFPYKDKILAEVEEQRRQKVEDVARRRQLAKEQRANGGASADAADAMEDNDEEFEEFDAEGDELLAEDSDDMEVDANPMAALLASAKARAAEFESKNGNDEDAMDDDSEEEDVRKDSSRKQFDKIYKQVVDSADVVLYVLDARDPIGTRSKDVEQLIMSADGGSKRLIFILNKIDLVPPPVLRQWLINLRRSFPTLPLRASKPAPNAKTFEHKDLTMKGTSETLFKALKTFAESRQLKRSVKVGIIGYPNVGKSSVINALAQRMGGRVGACPTGAEAGVTTSLREVKLDNKLKLLDSPGIVFPNDNEGTKENKIQQQARRILLNAVPPKEISDPVPAVTLLLKRLSGSEELFGKLMEVYDLPALNGAGKEKTTDFLIQVARKRGRLGRGGVPNLHSAAQTVINDWRDGRIQGWTDPSKYKPAEPTTTNKTAPALKTAGLVGDQKEIVKEWAAEFKLDGLWGDEPQADDTMEE